jgi:exo-beta-1,3-glucanase (GH17 family)
MRRVTTLLALATFVVAVAGCGGSKSASETSSSTSTTTSSTESTSTTTTTTSTTEASGTPNFASGKCKDLAASAAKIGQDLSASGSKGDIQDVAKEFQAFVKAVPAEIKGDVQTIANAITSYANAAQGIHFTPGQTPSAADLQKLQSALKSIDTQKVQAAEQHLEAWTKKNCT